MCVRLHPTPLCKYLEVVQDKQQVAHFLAVGCHYTAAEEEGALSFHLFASCANSRNAAVSSSIHTYLVLCFLSAATSHIVHISSRLDGGNCSNTHAALIYSANVTLFTFVFYRYSDFFYLTWVQKSFPFLWDTSRSCLIKFHQVFKNMQKTLQHTLKPS